MTFYVFFAPVYSFDTVYLTFLIITHNSIYGHLWSDLFAFVDLMGFYPHLVRI